MFSPVGNLLAMASNLLAMAFNLLAMASNLEAMALKKQWPPHINLVLRERRCSEPAAKRIGR